MIRPIAVVVLAGGAGVRMGGGKPQRLLGDRTLLQRAEARARAWSSLHGVAGGETVRGALPAIADVPGIEGPLGGLAAAINFAVDGGASHVLVLSCDTPFVPETLPERLAAVIADAAAALPESGGRLHPACGLWRADLGQALQAYAQSGRRSLTGFAECVGFERVVWPDQPHDPFFNLNTADDLAAAEARLRA